ncbi:MAG: hypothetical protein EKK52_11130 [Burkholderiales bacterium]|nr:MAG: hypothetical protein EKK52_11130 [Burkholderiales bacterium]
MVSAWAVAAPAPAPAAARPAAPARRPRSTRAAPAPAGRGRYRRSGSAAARGPAQTPAAHRSAVPGIEHGAARWAAPQWPGSAPCRALSHRVLVETSLPHAADCAARPWQAPARRNSRAPRRGYSRPS